MYAPIPQIGSIELMDTMAGNTSRPMLLVDLHTPSYPSCTVYLLPQIGSIELMDAMAGNTSGPMLLVDVRTPEEVEVSTVPGASCCTHTFIPKLLHCVPIPTDRLH